MLILCYYSISFSTEVLLLVSRTGQNAGCLFDTLSPPPPTANNTQASKHTCTRTHVTHTHTYTHTHTHTHTHTLIVILTQNSNTTTNRQWPQQKNTMTNNTCMISRDWNLVRVLNSTHWAGSGTTTTYHLLIVQDLIQAHERFERTPIYSITVIQTHSLQILVRDFCSRPVKLKV